MERDGGRRQPHKERWREMGEGDRHTKRDGERIIEMESEKGRGREREREIWRLERDGGR